jgi:hypothetical protein
MASVAVISTASTISPAGTSAFVVSFQFGLRKPIMGMRSLINLRGANSAGTAILQKAFAATSKAHCLAAALAASSAASEAFWASSFLVGGGLKLSQQ